jgi:hypothetical protein
MLGNVVPHELADDLGSRPIFRAAGFQKCLPQRTLDANTQA